MEIFNVESFTEVAAIYWTMLIYVKKAFCSTEDCMFSLYYIFKIYRQGKSHLRVDQFLEFIYK